MCGFSLVLTLFSHEVVDKEGHVYDVVKFNQHAKKDREYINDILYLCAVFVGVFH